MRSPVRAVTPRAMCALSVVLLSAYCASSAQQQTPDERGAWCRLVAEWFEHVPFADLSPADTAVQVVADRLAGQADTGWLVRNGSFPFEGKRYFGAGVGRLWAGPYPRPVRDELIPLGEHDGVTLYGRPPGEELSRIIYVMSSRPGLHEPCRMFYYLEASEMR
jgi:hypothetical protein